MMPPAFPQKGTSYMVMPAKEVLRMARNSIIEINATRAQMKRKVVDATSQTERNGLRAFLTSRSSFIARDIAIKQAEHMAENLGWGDVAVCEALAKMSELILNDIAIPDQQKVLYISAADFASIS